MPTNTLSETLSIFDALIVALLGYATVFAGLVVLMYVIIAMGKFFIAQANKNKEGTTNAR